MHYAFLGEPGSWSHQAARSYDSDALLTGYKSFADIAAALADGMVDWAVVPVRNSLTGIVNASAPVMELSGLKTLDHFTIPIKHCLIANQPLDHNEWAGFSGKLFSHPQGLKQCAVYLSKHLPNASQCEASDTSGAVLLATQAKEPTLAIGSAMAASIHGATILEHNINDDPDNETTFAVVMLEKI